LLREEILLRRDGITLIAVKFRDPVQTLVRSPQRFPAVMQGSGRNLAA